MPVTEIGFETVPFNKKLNEMKIIINRSFFSLIIAILFYIPLISQDSIVKLTLFNAIETARKQSPDALMAKHKFRASYWQYQSYRAKYLPAVTFNGSLPSFNKSIIKDRQGEGSSFFRSNESSLIGGLSISQQIGLTGGNVSINSGFERLDNYLLDSTSYNANLLNIAFRQPIFKYNTLRWERKIQPMMYEEARRVYVEEMEQVSLTTTNLFFNLLF
ncbi:MAG: TolC family protein, partial [Bacteroidetes bacterium]|nr:TolC family protein [Bacteroidota bacterium]